MLERGSKSYLRSGWLAFCVCAAWSLPLCCWAFGRLWCLVLSFCFFCRPVVAPCRLALSVSALPLALCFFKRATTQGTIYRAASPELPFSGIPAIVTPDDQVASGGLFCLGHYFIVVVLAGCGYRFLSFPSSSSLEVTPPGVDRTLHKFVADTF